MDMTVVKKYLRIDFDDDDEIIQLIMDAAKDYIKGAVGSFDITNPKVKLLYLRLVATMYENKLFTVDTSNDKVSWITSSIILQLQLESDGNEYQK